MRFSASSFAMSCHTTMSAIAILRRRRHGVAARVSWQGRARKLCALAGRPPRRQARTPSLVATTQARIRWAVHATTRWARVKWGLAARTRVFPPLLVLPPRGVAEPKGETAALEDSRHKTLERGEEGEGARGGRRLARDTTDSPRLTKAETLHAPRHRVRLLHSTYPSPDGPDAVPRVRRFDESECVPDRGALVAKTMLDVSACVGARLGAHRRQMLLA